MKKIIILFTLYLLVGCSMMNNSPTMTVSSFFQKYQNLDNDILKELDNMIEKEDNMTKNQKEEYKTLLEKQYQNLSYKIVKEETTEDISQVDVEIEVLNYQNAKIKAKQKVLENNNEDYIDLQLKEMKHVKDKIKYNITLILENKNGVWKINKLTDEDIKKIHGILIY